MDKPFALDAIINFRVDLFRRGLTEAVATPIGPAKLGKYEARQADIRFLDGDDNPTIMRVIVGQPSPTVLVVISCRAEKSKWPASEKVVEILLKSFSLEEDKLGRD